jgi:hypothetical protein
LILYQTFADLLAKSDAPGGAKFVVISSKIAQQTEMGPNLSSAYGISKVAANFVTKKIDMEVPGVIAFPMR